jgi:hypothetical protein
MPPSPSSDYYMKLSEFWPTRVAGGTWKI